MAALTLRTVKGSPLTSQEIDNNFAGLDNLKIELGGDLGGSTSAPVVVSLRGKAVSTATPTTGQTLTWSGSAWIPATPTGGGGDSFSSVVTSVVTSHVTNSVSSTVTSTAISTINTGITTYPAFNVYLDAGQASQNILGNGTQQKVTWNAEEFDVGNCFANSKFTPNVAGYYQLNATVRLDGGSLGTGENMVVIWKNGSEHHRGWNNTGMLLGNSWASMQVSALVYANGTTDYFEIYVQHGSTSTLTLTRGNNISWFNGVYVPTQVITSISSTTVVSSTVASAVGGAVSSAVVTSAVAAGRGVIQVLDDISNQFAQNKKIFNLKLNNLPITEGIHYGDNKDFTVQIGGRLLNAAVPQITTLGPWISLYVAERARSYKVTGSRIIFYSHVAEHGQSAEIRINNVSALRQKRSRYPLSPNTIVLGD